jgi:hypothetical protein
MHTSHYTTEATTHLLTQATLCWLSTIFRLDVMFETSRHTHWYWMEVYVSLGPCPQDRGRCGHRIWNRACGEGNMKIPDRNMITVMTVLTKLRSLINCSLEAMSFLINCYETWIELAWANSRRLRADPNAASGPLPPNRRHHAPPLFIKQQMRAAGRMSLTSPVMGV